MFFISWEQIAARFFILLSTFVLLLVPVALASAASIATTPSYRASVAAEFSTGLVDASLFTDLNLSFDFDATTLDFGPPQDSFSYGFRSGSDEYVLGTFLGLAGSSTNETGTIAVALPEAASVTDLVLFIKVIANSTAASDKVELRNIILSGNPKPVITDICSNIIGIQESVPNGYQINNEGECVIIPPLPIDICPNLAGLQEALPAGYEKNTDGDCFLVPLPIVDICPNLAGEQINIPEGYQKDLSGSCVVIPPSAIDLCPNLLDLQIIVPEGMFKNAEGDCVALPVVPTDLCPNIDGVQASVPSGMQLNSAGQCVAIVIENPPTPPSPKPKQCPRGFSKWIDKFNESHIWRADDVYRAVILVGGPISRSANRDRAHFLYIAGPTEVGDKYYRRFHKISLVCVKG